MYRFVINNRILKSLWADVNAIFGNLWRPGGFGWRPGFYVPQAKMLEDFLYKLQKGGKTYAKRSAIYIMIYLSVYDVPSINII